MSDPVVMICRLGLRLYRLIQNKAPWIRLLDLGISPRNCGVRLVLHTHIREYKHAHVHTMHHHHHYHHIHPWDFCFIWPIYLFLKDMCIGLNVVCFTRMIYLRCRWTMVNWSLMHLLLVRYSLLK